MFTISLEGHRWLIRDNWFRSHSQCRLANWLHRWTWQFLESLDRTSYNPFPFLNTTTSRLWTVSWPASVSLPKPSTSGKIISAWASWFRGKLGFTDLWVISFCLWWFLERIEKKCFKNHKHQLEEFNSLIFWPQTLTSGAIDSASAVRPSSAGSSSSRWQEQCWISHNLLLLVENVQRTTIKSA